MTATDDPRTRTVPEIPPPGESIRVVFDTDAKNEIDDQWALVLALLSLDRFEIEGFVGATFDNERGGRDSVDRSVREIETVLEKAGFAGEWPVKRGSHPMQYADEPSESEGVDFIVDRALAGDPDDPLWVVGLGAATDMASALLQEERIRDRVVAFWHLRTDWPDRCTNFNVFNDVRAARALFHSPLPFVLFDTGGHLTCPMAESERAVAPYGEIGAYLHEYRHEREWFADPEKGFYDLGDVAALVDPGAATWETVECPSIGWDLSYQFEGELGRILRCADVDRDRAFELLYERLRARYG
jgi:inosine-uridine nucleoside N-ribohydrolase